MRKLLRNVISFLLIFSMLVTGFQLVRIETVKAATVVPTKEHIHTQDCYAGHNHNVHGCNGPLYDCGCNAPIKYKYVAYPFSGEYRQSLVCSKCGKEYVFEEYTYYEPKTDGQGRHALYINGYFNGTFKSYNIGIAKNVYYENAEAYYYGTYAEARINYTLCYQLWSSLCNDIKCITNVSLGKATYPNVKSMYASIGYMWTKTNATTYSCGITNEDTTPECNQVVTELVPLAVNQTINADQKPDFTATATFLDGHTEVVTCSPSGLDMKNYNVPQTVTLSYGNYSNSAKNKTPFTNSITVTVNGYFDLILGDENSEVGTVSGGGLDILCGTPCIITATTNQGYIFDGWYLGSNRVSGNESYTFYMPARNVYLQAKWKKIDNIQANLNSNFQSIYLDYFNGTAYDIDDQSIIVDKSMLNVRANFDDGTFLVLSDDQYSLENNTIKNIGENLVKVKLNGSSYENYVRVIGYSLTFNKNLLTALPAGTYIDFSWLSNKSDCAYELELDGKIVKMDRNNSYRYSGLKPSTQHTYRLKTINVSGTVQWSSIRTIFTTEAIITETPENISSKATNNKIIIQWDAVDGAEGYDIQMIAPDGTSKEFINYSNNTTCELSNLKPNTTYRFRVRARSEAFDGPWSEDIQNTTKQLDTPQNITIKSSDTSILFFWDKVEGATSYKLKVNGIELAETINETSYLYTTTPNTEYTYSIMSVGSTGESSWREEKRIFSLPAKPDIPADVIATVTDTQIMISWTELPDNDIKGYDIELDKIEANEITGDEIILENGTEALYSHDELEPFTLYSYRVRARNELVEGDWSQINYIRTLAAKPVVPKGITIKSTQTGATLSWKPELGATGYDLYVYKLDENDNELKIEEITNIEECKYTHRKQTYGEEYRYRIRTRNVQGISDWSCDIINNAIKAECKKNNTIDLGLTATDVVDFSSYEMVVTYNPNVVEVLDLSTLTGNAELTIGKIEDTNITIKEFSNGSIVFAVDKAVLPGEAWTGVINGIKFKAKEKGGTTITYTVFTKQQR